MTEHSPSKAALSAYWVDHFYDRLRTDHLLVEDLLGERREQTWKALVMDYFGQPTELYKARVNDEFVFFVREIVDGAPPAFASGSDAGTGTHSKDSKVYVIRKLPGKPMDFDASLRNEKILWKETVYLNLLTRLDYRLVVAVGQESDDLFASNKVVVTKSVAIPVVATPFFVNEKSLKRTSPCAVSLPQNTEPSKPIKSDNPPADNSIQASFSSSGSTTLSSSSGNVGLLKIPSTPSKNTVNNPPGTPISLPKTPIERVQRTEQYPSIQSSPLATVSSFNSLQIAMASSSSEISCIKSTTYPNLLFSVMDVDKVLDDFLLQSNEIICTELTVHLPSRDTVVSEKCVSLFSGAVPFPVVLEQFLLKFEFRRRQLLKRSCKERKRQKLIAKRKKQRLKREKALRKQAKHQTGPNQEVQSLTANVQELNLSRSNKTDPRSVRFSSLHSQASDSPSVSSEASPKDDFFYIDLHGPKRKGAAQLVITLKGEDDHDNTFRLYKKPKKGFRLDIFKRKTYRALWHRFLSTWSPKQQDLPKQLHLFVTYTSLPWMTVAADLESFLNDPSFSTALIA